MLRKNLPKGFARCPNCGSNNIQGEPLYLYEDEDDYGYGYDDQNDEDNNIAVFCVSCGHYLGETRSELFAKARALRQTVVRNLYRPE